MKTEYDKPNKRLCVTLTAEENQMIRRAVNPPGDADGLTILLEIKRQHDMHHLEDGHCETRLIVDWSNEKGNDDGIEFAPKRTYE